MGYNYWYEVYFCMHFYPEPIMIHFWLLSCPDFKFNKNLLQNQIMYSYTKVTTVYRSFYMASKTSSICTLSLFEWFCLDFLATEAKTQENLAFSKIVLENLEKNVAKIGVLPKKSCQKPRFLFSKSTWKMKKLSKSGCCPNRGFPKLGFYCITNEILQEF